MDISVSVPQPVLLSQVLAVDLTTVEAGVAVDTLSRFVAESGLPLGGVLDVVIPARTLKHRRQKRQLLSRDESDKLARLIRLFDAAVRTFGDAGRASSWMQGARARFDRRTPLEMACTEVGGRMVEEMLGQIEFGIFA